MIKVKYHSIKESEEYSLRDLEFSNWKFPVGEVGVKLTSLPEYPIDTIAIYWKFDNNEELFQVLNLADAASKHNAKFNHAEPHAVLVIPYLPYSRQDRVCHEGESNALEVFGYMIKPFFDQVITFDVHNWEAAIKAIPALVNVTQANTAKEMKDYDFFIAPDAGAAKKIFDHPEVKSGRTKVITLNKTRVDGKVIYKSYNDEKIHGKVAVVDDLIDKGGTFLGIGQLFIDSDKTDNITQFDLFITHGWFTGGLNNLDAYYDNIYCFKLYNEEMRPYVKEFLYDQLETNS